MSHRTSLVGKPEATPLSHSMCEEEAVPVPKVLFPKDDMSGSGLCL